VLLGSSLPSTDRRRREWRDAHLDPVDGEWDGEHVRLWCFTAGAGTHSVTAVVADECGAKDTVSLTYNVTHNAAPSIALGNDTTVFQCSLANICRVYAVSDVNNNVTLESIVSGPGATLDTANNTLCLTPSAPGSYTVIVRVTDACGLTDQDTALFTVGLNSAPVAAAGADQSYFLCGPGGSLCWGRR